MKRRVTLTLLSMTLAALPPAFAQSPAPKAAAAAPVVGSSPEPARTAAEARRPAAANLDARPCLEFPTNLEVIKCAEKYLHRPRRG